MNEIRNKIQKIKREIVEIEELVNEDNIEVLVAGAGQLKICKDCHNNYNDETPIECNFQECANCGEFVLFTDNELWPKLSIADMPTVKAVISTTDFKLHYSATKEIEEAYNNIENIFSENYPNGFTKDNVIYPDGNDKELAIINYTSGTTSMPKGVMLRYECISANVEFGQNRIPSGPDDKIVSMLPMAHMYGLMFELIYPLCGGSSIYYIGRMPTPAILMGALAEVKPYLLITVPLVMEKIYKNKLQPVLNKPVMKVLTSIPGVNQLLFKKIRNTLMGAFGGNIREIVMGGAALNPDVEKWLNKIGIQYTVGYGILPQPLPKPWK